jgi:hypothetical protein
LSWWRRPGDRAPDPAAAPAILPMVTPHEPLAQHPPPTAGRWLVRLAGLGHGLGLCMQAPHGEDPLTKE